MMAWFGIGACSGAGADERISKLALPWNKLAGGLLTVTLAAFPDNAVPYFRVFLTSLRHMVAPYVVGGGIQALTLFNPMHVIEPVRIQHGVEKRWERFLT